MATRIRSVASLANIFTGGSSTAFEHLRYQRLGGITSIGYAMADYWSRSGQPNGGGSFQAVGAFASLDRTSVGALGQSDASSGRGKYLTSWDASLTSPPLLGGVTDTSGALVLYDRLLEVGLGGAASNNVTVNTNVPRYTDGAGNVLAVEIVVGGVDTGNPTIGYVDKNGVTQSLSTTAPGGGGFGAATSVKLVPFAAGQTGVRRLTTVSATQTGSTFRYSVVVLHPIATIPILPGGSVVDFTSMGDPPLIRTGAALNFLKTFVSLTGSTSDELAGTLHFAEI